MRDGLRARGFRSAAPVCTDPPVRRRATDPHQPAVAADMLALAQRADEPAALSSRQRRVCGFPDDGIPEQPDLSATLLIDACLHGRTGGDARLCPLAAIVGVCSSRPRPRGPFRGLCRVQACSVRLLGWVLVLAGSRRLCRAVAVRCLSDLACPGKLGQMG
jgi:hypothetical protein